jgi:DNA-binding MarR family transcriptional regulator
MILGLNDCKERSVGYVDKVVELFENNHAIMHKLADNIGLSFDKRAIKLFPVLERLEKTDKTRLKDLSAQLGLSSSMLCVTLGQMEKEGLVAREIDIKDRRNTYYSITQAGRVVAKEIMDRLREYIKRLFEPLGEEELKKVCEAIVVVNNALERYLDKQERKAKK